MVVEKFQASKTDKSLSKVVLYSETSEDRELLEDLLEYLEYLQQEREKEKQF